MDLELFLFGGEFQGGAVEAFNSFEEYKTETFKNFETFKGTVEALIENYGWDSKNAIATDINKSDVVFEMVDDEVMKVWFEKYR